MKLWRQSIPKQSPQKLDLVVKSPHPGHYVLRSSSKVLYTDEIVAMESTQIQLHKMFGRGCYRGYFGKSQDIVEVEQMKKYTRLRFSAFPSSFMLQNLRKFTTLRQTIFICCLRPGPQVNIHFICNFCWLLLSKMLRIQPDSITAIHTTQSKTTFSRSMIMTSKLFPPLPTLSLYRDLPHGHQRDPSKI